MRAHMRLLSQSENKGSGIRALMTKPDVNMWSWGGVVRGFLMDEALLTKSLEWCNMDYRCILVLCKWKGAVRDKANSIGLKCQIKLW